MTKTKTNRVRASVRKTPKTLRELNTGKMNKVMSKFIPARYDLHVEFALTNDQDLNDPLDFRLAKWFREGDQYPLLSIHTVEIFKI